MYIKYMHIYICICVTLVLMIYFATFKKGTQRYNKNKLYKNN